MFAKHFKIFSLSTALILGLSGISFAGSFFEKSFSENGLLPDLPPVNYVRSRTIDVKHLDIDLRFDWDKEQAYGTTVVTLAPFKTMNKFYLDAAEMQINSVKLANGTTLQFNYDAKKDNDNLEIILDRDYKEGEDLSVTIDYRTSYVNKAERDTAIGNFGRGLRFIKPTADNPNKPRQIWSQGETEFNRYWFPSYDSPNDFRTTELKATVEKPFTVVSNGKLVNVKDNNDNTRTFDWKMDTPYSNYLTSIVVAEYTEIKNGEYQGVPVIAYGYPSEAKQVAATTKRVPDMVKFFSEKTGVKYDYPKYSQAVVEDFGGGMENISATTQIEGMIKDDRELMENDSDSLQSHELAHQWFGDYVTCRDWGQNWLNESFATYFQALWDEESKGRDYFLTADVRANQQTYLQTWNAGNRRPVVTKYYANKDALFDNYAYPRGAAVLHMLRKHLGDDLFFKSLNHYLVSNAHKPVQTEQLRIAIEETTGQSMDWFFDEWLYKMGHPIFEVTKSYDATAKKLTLNVKQNQKIDPTNSYPQVEFFQTYVDIEIDGHIERVWIKPQAENVFTFDEADEPKLVNFDYEGTLVKELKFAKSIDELTYQARNDKDVLGRRWAISELALKARDSKDAADKDKILTSFRQTVEKDLVFQNRRAAITEIHNLIVPPPANAGGRGNRGGGGGGFGFGGPTAPAAPITLDDATIQTLLKATKDDNSLVRADALGLLGETQNATYADVYLSALDDQSYTVINNAAEALALTKTPKAFDALNKLAETPSWKNHLQISGLRGLSDLGDKRAIDTAIKLAGDKTAPPNVRTAAISMISFLGKGDPRAYPIVFEQFQTALNTNNFRGVITSLNAIVRIGDPRGQEAFDLAKAKFANSNQANAITNLQAQFTTAVNK